MPFILLISHRLVILWHQLHEIRQLDCGYLACTTCATHLFIYYLTLSLSLSTVKVNPLSLRRTLLQFVMFSSHLMVSHY